jgi:N,N'-diacetyllegionaminate synthase
VLELGVPALGIYSGERADYEFLGLLAASRLPLIMYSGVSSMEEVDEALAVVRHGGAPSVALLHCSSGFPTMSADCDLSAMDSIREAFGVPAGFTSAWRRWPEAPRSSRSVSR